MQFHMKHVDIVRNFKTGLKQGNKQSLSQQTECNIYNLGHKLGIFVENVLRKHLLFSKENACFSENKLYKVEDSITLFELVKIVIISDVPL